MSVCLYFPACAGTKVTTAVEVWPDAKESTGARRAYDSHFSSFARFAAPSLRYPLRRESRVASGSERFPRRYGSIRSSLTAPLGLLHKGQRRLTRDVWGHR